MCRSRAPVAAGSGLNDRSLTRSQRRRCAQRGGRHSENACYFARSLKSSQSHYQGAFDADDSKSQALWLDSRFARSARPFVCRSGARAAKSAGGRRSAAELPAGLRPGRTWFLHRQRAGRRRSIRSIAARQREPVRSLAAVHLLRGTENRRDRRFRFSGAQIRDGIKVLASEGAPPESDWPYDIAAIRRRSRRRKLMPTHCNTR